VGREALEAVVEGYPLRINPHFMSLIQSVGRYQGPAGHSADEEVPPSTPS
jgi:hypothetical protein